MRIIVTIVTALFAAVSLVGCGPDPKITATETFEDGSSRIVDVEQLSTSDQVFVMDTWETWHSMPFDQQDAICYSIAVDPYDVGYQMADLNIVEGLGFSQHELELMAAVMVEACLQAGWAFS